MLCWLRKLKQKFSGRITGYQLAFTNEVYAQRFIAVNPEAIAAGVLEIKTCRHGRAQWPAVGL